MVDPLTQVPVDAVDTKFPPPQYSSDFASIVGNAGTDSDGFESLFSSASAILLDAPNFLTGLDIAFALVDGSFPGVDAPWEKDFTDSLTAAIQQGDPDFNQFEVDLTGNSPPQPGGGGGSGGGGGGGGGTPACELVELFALSNVLPFSQQVIFQNAGTAAMHVQSQTLDDPTPGTFTVSPTLPATVVPGQRITLTLTQHKLQPFGYEAKFTVVTDDANSPHILCLQVANNNSGSGGSGGGGGGGGAGKGPIRGEASLATLGGANGFMR